MENTTTDKATLKAKLESYMAEGVASIRVTWTAFDDATVTTRGSAGENSTIDPTFNAEVAERLHTSISKYYRTTTWVQKIEVCWSNYARPKITVTRANGHDALIDGMNVSALFCFADMPFELGWATERSIY